MKTLTFASAAMAALALALSIFALVRTDPLARPIKGEDAEDLARALFSRPRWDGTDGFFTRHRGELLETLEIQSFLESDGVGLALVRASAAGRTVRLGLWMRKTGSGREFVPFLSPHITDDPLRGKWIEKHQAWLEETEGKRLEWEGQSEGVW